MPEKDQVSPDAFIAWQKDPNGTEFWQEIREMFAKRASALRNAVREGNVHQAAIHSSAMDVLEEVLQLPDVLIQERALAEKDKIKEQEGDIDA